MITFRRRLIFWLIKAYLKKWGKVIALSFVLGLAVFFGILKLSGPITRLLQIHKRPTVGIAGAYNVSTLPLSITSKLSRGLTSVTPDGTIKPDLASSWEIQDSGKTYTFHLKKDAFFNDNTPLTSDTVTYDFTDVRVERPNRYTIVYKLKDQYAPFLVTVSRPIFKKGFVGIGDFKLEKVDLNGTFIKSLRLVSTKNKNISEDYQMYPTQEAVKIAFALGEITQTEDLNDDSFAKTSFHTFPNIKTQKNENYSQLVTLFYNTKDKQLGDKRVRSALTYALPDTFSEGERNYLPYPKNAWFYNKELTMRQQDYDHAKTLLDAAQIASPGAKTVFTMKVLQHYRKTAEEISKAWEKLGIQVKIEEVDTIPNDFQMYLGDFFVPHDPDQYVLWHSDQMNNITHYKNLRIDKLLEDGRKTIDLTERKKIYDEFQKYLLDDSPASFLYHPYVYQLSRK